MFPGYSDHFFVEAQGQKAAAGKLGSGIADADEKIKFVPQLFDFGEDALVVVLEGDQMQLIFREFLVYLVPQIHKRSGRVQKGGAYPESIVAAARGGAGIFQSPAEYSMRNFASW